IVRPSDEKGYYFRILKAVEAVNESQKKILVAMVQKHFGKNLKGKRLAVWGLAFKPYTDYMREAPSMSVIEGLLAAGAKVAAYDPEEMDEAKKRLFGDKIEYADVPMAALEG